MGKLIVWYKKLPKYDTNIMQIYILQKFYFLIFYKIKKCNFAKIIKNKITEKAILFETLNKPLPAQLAKVIVEYLKLNKR